MASRWTWLLPLATTFAWALTAFLVGQLAALAALLLWSHGDLYRMVASPYDGLVVTLSVLVLNPVSVAVLVFAARLRSAEPVEYLGLVPPRPRLVVIGLIGILVIIGLTDALLFASGRAIVSPFQSISYRTAAAEGLLPLMWFATLVVAPAGEEILFRGFLFRGFVRSPRAAGPAIVAISLLWSLLHVQYDWTGMSEIFVAGLFLGWMRYTSGSTLLTIVLHGLFNLEGMIETMLQLNHF
jgi:uncharacterized protein